jgi:Domain of unknown function DUF29
MQTKTNWDLLVINSHYQTAEAVQSLLQEGNTQEASIGLHALIAAMARTERQAVKSQLVRLMSHIIKWKTQLERRSRSWVLTILNARSEIEDSQEEMPSLNRDFIESIWDKCFIQAVRQAEAEMDKDCEITFLSWEEVFVEAYILPRKG